jgi:hypothetical protein
MRAARAVATVRLLWSVVLLAEPRRILRAARASGEDSSARARGVVMVLGARNLVQAVVEFLHPSRMVLGLAAGVDAVHAASFLGLATAERHARWRRAAQLNVLTALAFCAATAITAIAGTTTPDRQETP